MFFSVVVLFIWSFIPLIGYWLGKLFNRAEQISNRALFFFGLGVGVFEKSLFHFDILINGQQSFGILISFILFFVIAFISIPENKIETTT